MKITFDPKTVGEALEAIKPSNKVNRPIESAVLLTVTGTTLVLTSCTESRAMALTVDCQASEDGVAVLPHKSLNEAVKCCKASATLTLLGDDATAQLKSGRSQYRIPVAGNADEYPAFPSLEGDTTTISIETDLLLQAIAETGYAISTDETKTTLCGLHIQPDNGVAEFAATDGHRLTVTKSDADIDAGVDEVNIPGSTIALLPRLLQAPDTTLEFDSYQCRITAPGVVFISRLLEGSYPNYRQLIPTRFDWTLKCDRSELRSALSSVGFMAELNRAIVKLSVVDGELTIVAEAQEAGAAMATVAVAAMTGVFPTTMGMNLRYLRDGVQGSGSVTIQGNGATQPVVLTGEDTEALCLVMPVQVRS